MFLWILSLTIILCTILILYRIIKLQKLPPGPIGLPFVGYIPFLKSPLFKSLDVLYQKYGKIFSFTAYGSNVVVINDYKMVKEALITRKDFSGRTTLFVNGALAENHGISNYDGIDVEKKKKIIQNFLKMNDNFESIIDSETDYFMDFIREHCGSSQNSRSFFNKAICNIIWNVIFGYRFNYNDTSALKNVEQVAVNNSTNDMLAFRQLLPNAFAEITKRNTFVRSLLHLNEVFNRYNNVLEYIRNIMIQQKSEIGCESCVFEYSNRNKTIDRLTNDERLRLVFELFAAGTDTTILSLQWATLLLSINPDIQNKMRDEINQNITQNSLGKLRIAWQDINGLRYCSQVIAEVHRFASVTPLALPHRTTNDCIFIGYQIPKHSMVLIGVYSIHNDTTVWSKPEEFNPSRFDNETSLTENLLPFSIGKRSCPGAMLAQAEIFTILTNLVYQFKIEPTQSNLCIEDLGIGSSGLTRAPKYYEVIFESI